MKSLKRVSEFIRKQLERDGNEEWIIEISICEDGRYYTLKQKSEVKAAGEVAKPEPIRYDTEEIKIKVSIPVYEEDKDGLQKFTTVEKRSVECSIVESTKNEVEAKEERQESTVEDEVKSLGGSKSQDDLKSEDEPESPESEGFGWEMCDHKLPSRAASEAAEEKTKSEGPGPEMIKESYDVSKPLQCTPNNEKISPERENANGQLTFKDNEPDTLINDQLPSNAPMGKVAQPSHNVAPPKEQDADANFVDYNIQGIDPPSKMPNIPKYSSKGKEKVGTTVYIADQNRENKAPAVEPQNYKEAAPSPSPAPAPSQTPPTAEYPMAAPAILLPNPPPYFGFSPAHSDQRAPPSQSTQHAAQAPMIAPQDAPQTQPSNIALPSSPHPVQGAPPSQTTQHAVYPPVKVPQRAPQTQPSNATLPSFPHPVQGAPPSQFTQHATYSAMKAPQGMPQSQPSNTALPSSPHPAQGAPPSQSTQHTAYPSVKVPQGVPQTQPSNAALPSSAHPAQGAPTSQSSQYVARPSVKPSQGTPLDQALNYHASLGGESASTNFLNSPPSYTGNSSTQPHQTPYTAQPYYHSGPPNGKSDERMPPASHSLKFYGAPIAPQKLSGVAFSKPNPRSAFPPTRSPQAANQVQPDQSPADKNQGQGSNISDWLTDSEESKPNSDKKQHESPANSTESSSARILESMGFPDKEWNEIALSCNNNDINSAITFLTQKVNGQSNYDYVARSLCSKFNVPRDREYFIKILVVDSEGNYNVAAESMAASYRHERI